MGSVYKTCAHNYKQQTPVVEPEENPNGVINVPADCAGLEEALKGATPGQTILVAEGEHTWRGKIELDKAVHIRGIRDKVTGFPASKLRGRWRVRIPPPTPWDRNPQEVCTFTNVWCESDSGYCMEITLGHVQMHNSRVYCNAGTSLSVSNSEVGLHGCVLGFPKPSANYGLVVGHKGVVWMHQSVLRCCKNGAFLRETGVLKMHMCEVHRSAHAFGCIIPNESSLEVTNSRLAEIESNWHRASRPASLFQQANYNEKGKCPRVAGFPQRAAAACCGNADSQRLRPEQARSSTFTAMKTASTRSSTENTLKRKPRRRPSRSTRNSSPASRGSSTALQKLTISDCINLTALPTAIGKQKMNLFKLCVDTLEHSMLRSGRAKERGTRRGRVPSSNLRWLCTLPHHDILPNAVARSRIEFPSFNKPNSASG